MNDLIKRRQQLEEIDSAMAELFERRMKICEGIADYKRENSLPILDIEREKQLLEKIFSGTVPGDINDASRRYEEVKNMIDEKELRWLELSDIE